MASASVATSDNNVFAIGTAQGFTGRMTGASYDTTTGGDHSVGLADKVQATAGTPTMLTWRQTINASDRWAAITFALRPNAAPSVNLTSPTNGAVFTAPATITLTATASDADGTVARVEFFQGTMLLATLTTAPYTFTLNNVAAGVYTFTAKAIDNQGANTTSAAVTVTVNALPAITLTSPANGASFTAPASITVTAVANDSDGTITQVALFQGTTLLATLTVPPYTTTLNNVQVGSYTYTARGTDNFGGVTTSDPVTVTVASGVAQLYFIYTDQLNTPRVITDQTNKVVWRWDNNDPFGANVPDEDPDGDGIRFTCNLRFPGQYADRETGMNYNYFRDYDSSIGRYVQSDPIGLRGGINLYAYVNGNPISGVDLLGLVDPYKYAPRPQYNGNLFPGFIPQDYACTVPSRIEDLLNLNDPYKQGCCVIHDQCYARYGCNFTSFAGNLIGDNFACQQCNADVIRCLQDNPYKPLFPKSQNQSSCSLGNQ